MPCRWPPLADRSPALSFAICDAALDALDAGRPGETPRCWEGAALWGGVGVTWRRRGDHLPFDSSAVGAAAGIKPHAVVVGQAATGAGLCALQLRRRSRWRQQWQTGLAHRPR